MWVQNKFHAGYQDSEYGLEHVDSGSGNDSSSKDRAMTVPDQIEKKIIHGM